MADFHYPHGGQIADSSAKAGTADLERARKFAFRRDLVPRLQGAVLNEGTDVVHHLHGAMRIRLFLLNSRHNGSPL